MFSATEKVLSFEFFPPKLPEQLSSTYDMITRLSRLNPSFMSVTYGAGGGTRQLTREMVSFINNKLNITAVAHLTCVGHSQREIDEIVEALKQEGISNILALRGDPPQGSLRFEKHPEGFENARQLVTHLKSLGGLNIAVAGYPEVHHEARSPEADILYLKEKVEAGAQVILTQLFFDVNCYLDFLEKTAAIGIKVPIVPGIMPISNVSQIARFTSMCGATIPKELNQKLFELQDNELDVVNYGIEYAVSMCKKLLKNGAPGIHIYTLNKSQQVEPIVNALRAGGVL